MRMPFSTVSRYVLFRTIPWIGICLFGAVSIFLITQLLRTASVFIGAAFWPMIRLIALLSVPVLTYALAPSCLIALFAAAGKMQADEELPAVDALGVSRWKALSSLAGFFLLLTLGDAFLWLVAVPAALSPARDIALVSIRDAAVRQLEPGRFNHPLPGLVFYSAAREGDVFLRPFVDWRSSGGHFEIAAEEAALSAGDPKILTMRFTNGRAFIRGDAEGASVETTDTPKLSASFKDFMIGVPVDDLSAQKLDFLPSTLTISTTRLAASPIEGIAPDVQQFALWRRIAGPIGFFFLSFFGLWVAFGVQWKNRARAVFFGTAVFLMFQLFSRWGESLFQQGHLSPKWGAVFPVSVPALLCAAFILIRLYEMTGRAAGRTISGAR